MSFMNSTEPETDMLLTDMLLMIGLRPSIRSYASGVSWVSPCRTNEWFTDDCEPLLRSIRSSQFRGRAGGHMRPLGQSPMLGLRNLIMFSARRAVRLVPGVLLPVLPFFS